MCASVFVCYYARLGLGRAFSPPSGCSFQMWGGAGILPGVPLLRSTVLTAGKLLMLTHLEQDAILKLWSALIRPPPYAPLQ